MRLLKPIKGEEWIEKFRSKEFWIGEKRSYPQKFYSRLCHSYISWWLHLRLHYPPFGRLFFFCRLPLLIEPLNSGGLYSHVRSFLFNFVVADCWWSLKHKVWKYFHKREWQQQLDFYAACDQAMQEGRADEMSPPPELSGIQFRGSILGERYFKRVAQILKEKKNVN